MCLHSPHPYSRTRPRLLKTRKHDTHPYLHVTHAPGVHIVRGDHAHSMLFLCFSCVLVLVLVCSDCDCVVIVLAKWATVIGTRPGLLAHVWGANGCRRCGRCDPRTGPKGVRAPTCAAAAALRRPSQECFTQCLECPVWSGIGEEFWKN